MTVRHDMKHLIGDEIFKEVQAFRLECMRTDVDQNSRKKFLGTLLGIKVTVTLDYEKPKLTPEEEAALIAGIDAKRRALGITSNCPVCNDRGSVQDLVSRTWKKCGACG